MLRAEKRRNRGSKVEMAAKWPQEAGIHFIPNREHSDGYGRIVSSSFGCGIKQVQGGIRAQGGLQDAIAGSCFGPAKCEPTVPNTHK